MLVQLIRALPHCHERQPVPEQGTRDPRQPLSRPNPRPQAMQVEVGTNTRVCSPIIEETDEESEVTCAVCLEPYSDDHSPRTLRCGHTVCSPCLEILLDKAPPDRNCPECRRPLKVSAVGHLPVSYTILRLSRALQLVGKARSRDGGGIEMGGVEWADSCLEHQRLVQWWCPECEVFMCRDCSHPNTCPEVMPAAEAMIHLKQAQVEEAERSVQMLTDHRQTLEAEMKQKQAAVDKIMEEMTQLEEKVKRLKAQVIEVEEVEAQVVEAATSHRLSRVISRARQVKTATNLCLVEERSRSPSPSPDSSPDPSPTPPLQDQTIHLRELMQRLQFSQSMYAVHEGLDGKKRYGRLSLDDRRILLHAMTTDPPPDTALLVPGYSLTPIGIGYNPIVFFDVSVDERFEGRVTLVVFRDAPQATRFVDLCTAKTGETYKGRSLSQSSFVSTMMVQGSICKIRTNTELTDMDEPDDYSTILMDSTNGRRNIYPGLISGLCPSSSSASHPTSGCVNIHLYHVKGSNDPWGFGKVLTGLGILRQACTEIVRRCPMVSDCGQVLAVL